MMSQWSEWTRQGVEERLIEAFRALPATPLYGRASVLHRADGRASPATWVLSWLDLVGDQDDRLFLATWARCKAERESFAAMCVGLGWSQATAERGRRRGSAAIASALALPACLLEIEADLKSKALTAGSGRA